MYLVPGKVFLFLKPLFYPGCVRFHQFYVAGETEDCSKWKENFADCELWVDRADREAAQRVIAREKVCLIS